MRQRIQLALVAIATLLVAGVATAIVLDSSGNRPADSDALAFTAPETTLDPSTTSSATPSPSDLPTGAATEAPSRESSVATTRNIATPSSARPPITPPPPAAVATPAAPPAPPAVTPEPEAISYTVKPGDTLANIAAWFELNGFTNLYEANRAIIGSNPDLIRPGQVFTITGGTLQMPQG